MLNKEGNLKEHIKETGSKASGIITGINEISSKQNVGQEEIRVKFKLFETCLVPAILHRFETWGKILKSEVQAIEKIQNQSLNKTLQLPVTKPSTGLLMLMETGIWPAKERIEYSTLMLIHSIINSNKERISQKIILEQRKKGMTNTLYERARDIGESIGMNIDQAEKMKKSTWKREVKTKIKGKIQQKLADDLKGKFKARTIQKDKWQMKEYIKKGNADDIEDIWKIRLHMWDVKKNYPKNDTQIQYVQFAEKKKIQQSMCQIVKQNLRKESTLLEIAT